MTLIGLLLVAAGVVSLLAALRGESPIASTVRVLQGQGAV